MRVYLWCNPSAAQFVEINGQLDSSAITRRLLISVRLISRVYARRCAGLLRGHVQARPLEGEEEDTCFVGRNRKWNTVWGRTQPASRLKQLVYDLFFEIESVGKLVCEVLISHPPLTQFSEERPLCWRQMNWMRLVQTAFSQWDKQQYLYSSVYPYPVKVPSTASSRYVARITCSQKTFNSRQKQWGFKLYASQFYHQNLLFLY